MHSGIALRVPTPNVSVVDLVIQTEKKTFAEEVNEAFREYSRAQGQVRLPLIISVASALSLCACVACTVYMSGNHWPFHT